MRLGIFRDVSHSPSARSERPQPGVAYGSERFDACLRRLSAATSKIKLIKRIPPRRSTALPVRESGLVWMSDSFNYLGGLAADIAGGDLPGLGEIRSGNTTWLR